jgi:hypothetical protein
MKKALFLLVILSGLLAFFLPGYIAHLVPWKLEKKTGLSWSFDSIDLSWRGPQKFRGAKFEGKNLVGQIETIEADLPLTHLLFGTPRGLYAFRGASSALASPPIRVADVDIDLTLIEADSFNLNAKGNSLLDLKIGSFEMQALLRHLKKENFDLTLNLNLIDLPSPVIDQVISFYDPRLEGLASGVLGLWTRGSLKTKIGGGNGSVDLSLLSSDASIEIHGDFDGAVATLREPLTATFQINEQLSELVLHDVNPLFLTAIRSITPASLTISAQNFAFPIHRPKEAWIQEAVIDLGRVQCQNGAALSHLLSFLKSKKLMGAKEMEVWFTPLEFSMKNGKLLLERMDALIASSLHFCAWGGIDFTKDYVAMTIGIPADTLQKAFKLPPIPSSYVLKLPLRGPLSSPTLETTGAAARIAALSALRNTPGQGFFGGLVGTLAGPDDERDTPPAKKPLPWDQ